MFKSSIINRLHILTLSAFAFAQPLYDLLGKNAEFFAVRTTGIYEALLLTLFLSLFIPAALIAIIETGRLFGQQVWLFLHALVTALLLAIISLPVLKNIPMLGAVDTYILAGLLSISLTYLYIKKHALQLFLTYLSPTAIIFPLLFIFHSQLSHLLFDTEPPLPNTSNISSETPIVMIIFDELPVSTLMSGKHRIDRKLFPGFASLADHSTWYPNTATVAEYTVQAIPAILTGNLPSIGTPVEHPKRSLNDWLEMPTYKDHPRNLFTALGSGYEFRVFESVSSLCPQSLCNQRQNHSERLPQTLVSLASDTFIIYLHIILPVDATAMLPRIDMNWSDFIGNNIAGIHDHIESDDVSSFERFIDALTPSDRPTLYFHHSTFPHNPWKFLPSGKEYRIPAHPLALSTEQTWKVDANLREPYQRHLLQTMLADTLLLKTLDKLKNEGIYDDALIIVTADHGASFARGENFRSASQNNYADIMDIPLFIKHPKQHAPAIDTAQLQSIDIIPTLFNALDETYPWRVDGKTSGRGFANNNLALPLFPRRGPAKSIMYDPEKKFDTVKRKTGLFGNIGIKGIFGGAEYGPLIGQPLIKECAVELPEIAISEQGNDTISYDSSSPKVTSLIKIMPPLTLPKTEAIAVTVNGTIAAVLPAASLPANNDHIYAMIDTRVLQSGTNRVAVSALLSSDRCKQYDLSAVAYDH